MVHAGRRRAQLREPQIVGGERAEDEVGRDVVGRRRSSAARSRRRRRSRSPPRAPSTATGRWPAGDGRPRPAEQLGELRPVGDRAGRDGQRRRRPRAPGPRTTTTIACSSSVSRRNARQSVARPRGPGTRRRAAPATATAMADQRPHERQLLEVPRRRVPGHRPARAQAVVPLEADLVAVQDRRHADVGQQQPERGPHPARDRRSTAVADRAPCRGCRAGCTGSGRPPTAIAARNAVSVSTMSAVDDRPAPQERARCRDSESSMPVQPFEDRRAGTPRSS